MGALLQMSGWAKEEKGGADRRENRHKSCKYFNYSRLIDEWVRGCVSVKPVEPLQVDRLMPFQTSDLW